MSKAVLQTLRYNLRQALNRGRLQDAADILTSLRQEDPLSLETRGFELEFYLNSNRLQEADALAGQLCCLYPQSGRIFFLAGKLAYRKKHYANAAVRFRESQRIYPHWQAQYWLGKTLTQLGEFQEAESLLLSVREQNPYALLDLAWLYERRNDLETALQACDTFLKSHPSHAFATEQRTRLKAKLLEPEALLEELNAMTELGEQVPEVLFPELVQKLFETGQDLRAREEVTSRLTGMDTKLGTRIAWICYHARAYDLACTLFLAHLEAGISNHKYLAALESAAAKCNRLQQVLETYQGMVSRAPHLYGRSKSLRRRWVRPTPSD